MEAKEILALYRNHPKVAELSSLLANGGTPKINLKGLSGSSPVLCCAAGIAQNPNHALFILQDKEEAAYFYDDLKTLSDENNVFFFPTSYKRSVLYEKIDNDNIVLRTEVLNRLSTEKSPIVIVSYPEALVEKVISGAGLQSNTLRVHNGEKLSIEFVNEVLIEYGFERTDFVYEPGQFSIRGSIIDIFSFSHEDPFRIDFFGDQIDSIRSFDVENQVSKSTLEQIAIVPDIQQGLKEETRVSFFKFLDGNTTVFCNNTTFVFDRIESIYTQAKMRLTDEKGEDGIVMAGELMAPGTTQLKQLAGFTVVDMTGYYPEAADATVEFSTSAQPVFNKNFELLGENLVENTRNGYRNIILAPAEKQIERLQVIFHDTNVPVAFDPALFILHQGFIDHDLKLCCYTDHQIFERYHRFKLRGKKGIRKALSLKDLGKLHPGDYVVHIDHGIGKFAGLVKMQDKGKVQEVMKLEYRDRDVLFVSIHSLHRISKYKGKEGEAPKINKLGTGAWQRMKEKTKKKVKDIAKDLIALYAQRRKERGFSFSPDSYLQQELEASFIYEDTPDQEKATTAVKEDMEKLIPMDRLVCGDVGFGKTEVAIRAAFKAVSDSKQVAILVPTTILALQHYKTFSERLKEFPATVEYVSRLRRPADITRIKKELKAGKVDILIGTHRLVGKDIHFKDLGLLIIDEEQKFGVSVKEKLKQLKINVDTLTLTATPIPRTLQFSLMGARDLSIINTAPPNRYPIVTEVHGFNEALIKEAIDYELARSGQVFIINNRVQNIYEVEALIKRLVPHARTVVGHGQMEGPKLEKIMLDFINGRHDVLIATTIIESGLDIPNTNTIIINNAQNFGLSDLHQLRGRVGRSNKKAFCYLLAPPLTTLAPEARRRLRAIEQFSELGSGFNIAMQDLDIRGAGNLLGGEQSGFIADIGFETYHRILNEAVQELKQEEFKSLFAEQTENTANAFLNVQFVNDCQIDTDMELLFPDEYITNITERMQLYRELDSMETEEQLAAFEQQLNDRFGKLPEQTEELLEVVRMRRTAIELGMEKVILKGQKMICHFPGNQESAYYQSPLFNALLHYIMQHPQQCHMKEKKGKLTLTFTGVASIKAAKERLVKIQEAV